jgi:tetratricopeptide (TPR) repeat protein
MPFTRFSNRTVLVLVAFVTAVFAACTTGQQSKPAEPARLGKLGTVAFSASCSNDAQANFLRGVAALHSFWYEVALDEFRESTTIDPDCMMGYWGEAMAHNHPIWGDPQETESARKVLEQINDTPKLTPREYAYLQAVKVLYGEGEKPARDRAYSAAMEKISRDYPDDVEAALFYALSLMGTVRAEDPAGLQILLRAGAIAADVYQKNANHPGAAHYILHAYDDPEHAAQALPAARHYAGIAPEAPHALHMPSHIFLQLGMWPEAAASNEASWRASDQWVKRKNLAISKRDYHGLHWLLYVYLQQGRHGKAEELLNVMRQSLAEFPKDDPFNLMFGTFTYASMTAAFVAETEQWDAAEQLLGSPHAKAEDSRSQAGSSPNLMQAYIVVPQIPAIFTRGLAAAAQGSPDAQKYMAELTTIREQQSGAKEPFIAQVVKMTEIQELEIAAMFNVAKGNFDDAIKTMKQATAREDAMPPPSGPPTEIKPPHELFGEILLRAGHPKEAAQQFTTSLRRHPNRARSLLGTARAAAKNGDPEGAAHAYDQFSRQWQQSDAKIPELREAQDYLKQAGAR